MNPSLQRRLLLSVAAMSAALSLGCAPLRQRQLKSRFESEVTGCRVQIRGSVMELSPCDGPESVARARALIVTTCQDLDAADIRVVTVSSWVPRYQSVTVTVARGGVCEARCIGRCT
jgi:hypothetical protein